MENPAKFRPLTATNKPEKTEETVLILCKEGRGGYGNKERFIPIQVGTIFSPTLDGQILTGFRALTEEVLSVTDARIVGWCPIDPTPPSEE